MAEDDYIDSLKGVVPQLIRYPLRGQVANDPHIPLPGLTPVGTYGVAWGFCSILVPDLTSQPQEEVHSTDIMIACSFESHGPDWRLSLGCLQSVLGCWSPIAIVCRPTLIHIWLYTLESSIRVRRRILLATAESENSMHVTSRSAESLKIGGERFRSYRVGFSV